MSNTTQVDEVDLEQYTVAELKQMAKNAGVHVPSDANKDEIITALEDAGVNPTSEDNPTAEQQDAEIMPLAAPSGLIVPLPLSGIVADAYGIGRRYNIALTDIQGLGAVTQGSFLLDILPAGAIMQLIRIKHSQAVAGPGPITACTAQVVDSVNNYGSAFDIFQAVSNTALSTVQLTTGNVGNFATTTSVWATLISTGGNFGGATAGALSIWLRWTILA